MNPNNIPQNRLPNYLASIPYGQIIILTNPAHGLTAKHIVLMEFIYSMAGQYDKSYLVNAMPVDCPELYDSVVCKVKTDDGDVVLVSDKKSLVEMLSEFWGLDYDEVCKTIRISAKKNKAFVISGESHPIRMPVKPIERVPEMGYESNGILLQALQSHTRDGILGDIRSCLKQNFDYDRGISIEEIIEIYNAEQKNRKTYSLDIHIEKKDVFEHPKWVQKIKSCDISLVSNTGEKYPLKISAQAKAIYLTYILYKDGLRIQDVSENEEFYKIFKKISSKMPRMLGIPDKFVFYDEEGNKTSQFGLFNDKLDDIRKAILEATNSVFLKEKFAVEGIPGSPYKVAGATDEDREFIKKEFGIK